MAIAEEVPRARVYGSDLSEEAIALARANARRFGLSVRFSVGNLFDAIPRTVAGTVDVITLHPPYVPAGEVKYLPDEIRDWEPVHTLTDSSRDGLGLIGRTVTEAPGWLRMGGWLLMEVSPDRAREVSTVFRAGGFRDVRSLEPGEMIVIEDKKFRIERFAPRQPLAHCFFEWIYFANVASTLDREHQGSVGGFDRPWDLLLLGEPPRGGRPVRRDEIRSVVGSGRRHAGGVQRADEGSRVRGRLLLGGSGLRVLHQLLRSEDL